MSLQRVCVYCASSSQCDASYFDETKRLGELLARNGYTIVYGGGGAGLMGALADAALAASGEVIGVLPHFMKEVEWGHNGLTTMRLVDDMHERKRIMIESSQAIIALPGGCGTLEELLEAITWKRLGLHTNPIIIVNTRGFYDPLITQLERCIDERFMLPKHRNMWTVVASVEEALPALHNAAVWSKEAIREARL
ncbi:TIGR00730 family Rossman fold protein [candidate division KSB1 bacterium]|nr:TIGR00730 family Rossman fold protein [candidate division KSB1 bacterium]